MGRLVAIALAALGGCSAEPCAGHSACIVLDLTDTTGTVSSSIDGLEVTLRGGTALVGTADSPDPRTLPLQTALFLPDGTSGSFGLSVIARRDGVEVGTGRSIAPVLVQPGVPGKAVVDLAGVPPGDGGGLDAQPPGDLGARDQAVADLSLADLVTPPKMDLGALPYDLAGADFAGLVCPGQAEFCDGFESGDFSWWSYSSRSGLGVQKVSVTQAAAHLGEYGLQVDDDGSGDYALLHHLMGVNSGTLWIRFFANVQTVPKGHYTSFAVFGDPASGPQIVTDDQGMGERWKMWAGDGTTELYDTMALADHHWYCLEMEIDFGANQGMGQLALFIEGNLVNNVVPVQPPSPIGELGFGLVSSPGLGAASQVFLDDVALSPQRIGCQ